MNFKRITAFFLALLLLVVAFASCDTPGEDDPSEPTDTSEPNQSLPGIDLSNYTLIRSEQANSYLAADCVTFSKGLSALTGKSIRVRNDHSAEAKDDTFEILIGDTNRPQSAAAKAALNGEGYSVTVNGNKIVIVASNDVILSDALEAFLQTYVKKLDNGNFEIPESITVSYNTLELSVGTQSKYSIVFAEDDFEYNKETALALAKKMKEITGASFSVYPESRATTVDRAIYIGKLKGEAQIDCAYYQSGLMLKDGSIYLFAWNRDEMEGVIAHFNRRLSAYDKFVSSAATKLCTYLPVSTPVVWSNVETLRATPLPEQVNYSGANTAANNGVVLSYENVSSDVYDSYLALLEANGYTSYYSRQASNNRFAGYCKGNEGVWVYYLADLQELRVTLEPYSPIPTFSADGAKVTEASLVQFGLRYTSIDKGPTLGMSYVITLEDGRYVIVDGGRDDVQEYGLADKLYKHLKNNNKRNDGKIKIAAWILTHSHSDHYDTFQEFGEKYGNTVELEYLLWNIPTAKSVQYAENVDSYLYDHADQFKVYFQKSKSYTLHTGYAFSVGGVEFEFLSTYEDIYPNALTEMNDTCLTFRATFNSGDTDEAKAIFLADIYKAHGDRLAAMWGSYLRTPIVQVAHHGWDNGGSQNLYNEIRAIYGLWSNSNQHLNHGSAYGSYIRKMLLGIKSTVKFYSNCDANGNPINTTVTFDGSIKITTVAQ